MYVYVYCICGNTVSGMYDPAIPEFSLPNPIPIPIPFTHLTPSQNTHSTRDLPSLYLVSQRENFAKPSINPIQRNKKKNEIPK